MAIVLGECGRKGLSGSGNTANFSNHAMSNEVHVHPLPLLLIQLVSNGKNLQLFTSGSLLSYWSLSDFMKDVLL